MSDKEKIEVFIDSELEDIVPRYLESKKEDIRTIRNCMANDDYPTLSRIGHSMKGSGGGYGFDAISEIGRTIEIAGKEKNDPVILKAIDDLADYLERVVPVYREEE